MHTEQQVHDMNHNNVLREWNHLMIPNNTHGTDRLEWNSNGTASHHMTGYNNDGTAINRQLNRKGAESDNSMHTEQAVHDMNRNNVHREGNNNTCWNNQHS